jgi:excisionase family DNA binding protein
MSEAETPARRSALETSQLLLPFAEREYIDVKRAARILGVSHSSVLALYASQQIEMIDYAKRKRKRVRYQSIVDLCDRLRVRHSIKDRRPPLPAVFFRHKDVDILPFPLEDTLSVEQVMEILGYSSPTPVYLMIEEGRFESYQLSSRNPWRISRSSLAGYLHTVRGGS